MLRRLPTFCTRAHGFSSVDVRSSGAAVAASSFTIAARCTYHRALDHHGEVQDAASSRPFTLLITVVPACVCAALHGAVMDKITSRTGGDVAQVTGQGDHHAPS